MKFAKKTGLICDKCPQYRDGNCLVFSVNVAKYGKPRDCRKGLE